jgi:hypothetical protein
MWTEIMRRFETVHARDAVKIVIIREGEEYPKGYATAPRRQGCGPRTGCMQFLWTPRLPPRRIGASCVIALQSQLQCD